MKIRNCARCGENHDGVEGLMPITRPVLDDAGNVLATHWLRCPTSGEPILVLVRQAPEAP